MRDNDKAAVIVARQHTSARQPREASPIVIAGLARGVIAGLDLPGFNPGTNPSAYEKCP